MKLDKIKFSYLIGMIAFIANRNLNPDEIQDIDDAININVEPVEVPGKADPATINELMRAIHAGEKIAAIKAYRSMTGYGLKEAKDAVEKDWERKYSKHELNEKLGKLNPPWDVVRFDAVKSFIESLY